MTDRLLDRYARPESCAERVVGLDSTEAGESHECFGWLRGNSRDRLAMLELRKKDGRILAVGYGWIERIEFDPAVGIALHVHGQTIVIKGSGLNTEVRPSIRLFDGLVRHRVPWVHESERTAELTSPQLVVESITWDEQKALTERENRR